MPYKILLVDDDANQLNVVKTILEDRMHCEATVVESGQEAINVLTSNIENKFDLVLLDLSMPEVDGIKVLNAIKPLNPDLPVIVRTGYDDLDMAVEAMKAGATDFVQKLDEPKKLQQCITNALRMHTLNEELNRIKHSVGNKISFTDIVGKSPAVEEMVAYCEKVSASQVPVLIEGESGVGKELIARLVHEASDWSDGPFITVNCGAIPENLVESILFGHEKGAFTGALYKTSGKFREAAGGTIFLDEIGELPLDIQVKLLRVLQDGEIDPVGGKQTIKVDVRIISATNRTLIKQVEEKTFREDLYYRLNVFPIYVPSLRERKSDIPLLIRHFLNMYSMSEGKEITSISQEAEKLLCNYYWPGNIRQLKNTIYRAVVLSEVDILDLEHFPQIQASSESSAEVNSDITKFGSISEIPSEGDIIIQTPDGNYRQLKDIEKDVISAALKHYNCQMSEVARRLGIGRSTLYRKINDLDIELETNNNADV